MNSFFCKCAGPRIVLSYKYFQLQRAPDVLKIVEVMTEAEKNPAQDYVLTQEEVKVIADFQNPGVQAALTLGLVQLRDALVEDLARQGPLPACVLEAIQPTPSVTDPTTTPNTNHYPNAIYSPTQLFTQNQDIPSPQSTPPRTPRSPPRSGAVRRPPSKRKYETTRDSPFTRCQWNSCGQVVENSSTAIVSHLVALHRIDLKSRNGTMCCAWDDCREDLLTASVSKHITSTHLRLTVVECPHCPDNRHFSRGDSLNAHIKAQHPDMYEGPSPKKPKVQ